MHFNVWFKTKSRQWLFAGDLDAAVKRAIRDGAEPRRISLLEWEAMLDHMHLRIGARNGGESRRAGHQLTGVSARVALRATPDIRLDAGLLHFWQKREQSQSVPPALTTRQELPSEGGEDA